MSAAVAEPYGAVESPPPPLLSPSSGLFSDDDSPVSMVDDGPDIFDLPEGEPEPPAADEDDEPEPLQQGSVTLRGYQNDAVKSVLREFKEDKVKSTLVVMATGSGKTPVMADLARKAESWGHGVLWLCHREELIKQGRRALARVGVHALIEKANHRAIGEFGMTSKTVVASVPTLRGDRLTAWPRDAFKLIISDEAHHGISPTWKEIPKYFNGARHVGFTATADRLDGQNIGKIFESLAYEFNLRDCINAKPVPWLVPIEAFPVETKPPIDLRDLRITAGDFNQGDLERTIQENIGTLVNAIVEVDALGDRRTIAFTPDIESAKSLAYALNDVGIKADWVSGQTKNRAEVLERHRAGEYQVLCNCMVATEGYDDPQIAAVLICRPTKSRSLYSQMVGRGTRTYPDPFNNVKPNCRIVDFAFITDKHKLVTPVDLYDNSETPDEVVERAKEIVSEGKERNLDAALEQAQIEFESAERVRIQRREVSARAKRYDPLACCEILGIRHKESMDDWFEVRPATEKMVNTLRKAGMDIPDDIGFGVAKKLLNAQFKRWDLNLASVKQVGCMIRLGMDPGEARRTSFQDASAWITAHKTW